MWSNVSDVVMAKSIAVSCSYTDRMIVSSYCVIMQRYVFINLIVVDTVRNLA